jgi:hypothetical protein
MKESIYAKIAEEHEESAKAYRVIQADLKIVGYLELLSNLSFCINDILSLFISKISW